MEKKVEEILRLKTDEQSFRKLAALGNPHVETIVARYAELCNPDRVIVCDDSPEDIAFIRRRAVELGEETPLAIEGHTVHFDGYHDQARDKANTKYLVPKGVDLGADINSIDRDEGLREIHDLMKNIMAGHEMYVRFFCLGPVDSVFSILALQITDSPYVAHSEDILYRQGYEQFKKLDGGDDFFLAVHSEGRLEGKVSKDVDKRRIYIDLETYTIYSVNTQYAGNTVGLKKLSMRNAIHKSAREGWLTEHMFIMGVRGPGGRTTYVTGAYPSACGKTSTAMLPGETIVGDDIAYLRVIDGEIRAVNVEKGIFGIIKDVNSQDDPVIYKALTTPGETIFSNVLVDENNMPYWIGKDGDVPAHGVNHSGEWFPGKKDADGNEIPPSHKNARYTISLDRLENLDPRADDPGGVPVGGVIYGGRDSDTSVPVEQAFDWTHGIYTKGAMLESETTSATLGKEGVRTFNCMSILDFLSYPIGKYLENNIKFGLSVSDPPLIFSVNYFLKDAEGNYLNSIHDKRVWIKWIERRIHGEMDAVTAPTGLIPRYEDLRALFEQVLRKEYTEEDYREQFKIRVQENLAKIDRILPIYRAVPSTPASFFETLEAQKKRLLDAREKFGDYIDPFLLAASSS